MGTDLSLRIARKDLADITRERSILLAILVQCFIAAFSGFLLVGLVAFYDPEHIATGSPVRVAYVGPPENFAAVLDDHPAVLVSTMSYEEALEAFREGRVDLVAEETSPDANGTRTVTLLVPDAEIRTTMLVTQMKDLLRAYERTLREAREDRIETTIVYVDPPGRSAPFYVFAYSVLLPLLIATPVFLSGAIATDSLTQEVSTRTLELLRSTPVSPSQLMLGKLLTPILLAPAQCLAWFVLLELNGIDIHHMVPLLILTTAFAVILTAASILVALGLRRQGEVQLVYSLLVLVAFAASLLLKQAPFNLIARLAIGNAGTSEALGVAMYLSVALLVLVGALQLFRARLEQSST